MTLSRYLTWAHWAVFAAGVFVVAASVLGSINFYVLIQGLANSSALHDTYYVVYNFWDLVLAAVAVIFATAAICWILRRMAQRAGGAV